MPAGRPPHVRRKETAELVELGVAQGTPHSKIARLLGIGIHQLRRVYGKELRSAKVRANLKMGGRLFNAGMSGNVTAMIFWLKCQAQWRESPQALEHSGPGGKPIPVAAAHAVSDDDAMKAYLRLVKGEPHDRRQQRPAAPRSSARPHT